MRAFGQATHARKVRGWCGALALALGLSLGLGPTAMAHRFRHPKTLRLGISGGQLLLEVQWDAQPGRQARRARQLFDRNTDGALDEQELALAMEAFERQQWTWLTITNAGQAIGWKRVELKPVGHRLPADSTRSIGIRLLYAATLTSSQAVTLTVADRSADKKNHIPLTVEVETAWSIRSASQGRLDAAGRHLSDVQLRLERPLKIHCSPSS